MQRGGKGAVGLSFASVAKLLFNIQTVDGELPTSEIYLDTAHTPSTPLPCRPDELTKMWLKNFCGLQHFRAILFDHLFDLWTAFIFISLPLFSCYSSFHIFHPICVCLPLLLLCFFFLPFDSEIVFAALPSPALPCLVLFAQARLGQYLCSVPCSGIDQLRHIELFPPPATPFLLLVFTLHNRKRKKEREKKAKELTEDGKD